jgi:hypothetical protein
MGDDFSIEGLIDKNQRATAGISHASQGNFLGLVGSHHPCLVNGNH